MAKKYIDADKLVEELKHYLAIQPDTNGLPGKYSYEAQGVKQAIDYALSLIKGFQQEKVLAVVPGFLDRDYHEEIRFSTKEDKFYGDTSLLLPEDSVSFEDLSYETIGVELLIKEA